MYFSDPDEECPQYRPRYTPVMAQLQEYPRGPLPAHANTSFSKFNSHFDAECYPTPQVVPFLGRTPSVPILHERAPVMVQHFPLRPVEVVYEPLIWNATKIEQSIPPLALEEIQPATQSSMVLERMINLPEKRKYSYSHTTSDDAVRIQVKKPRCKAEECKLVEEENFGPDVHLTEGISKHILLNPLKDLLSSLIHRLSAGINAMNHLFGDDFRSCHLPLGLILPKLGLIHSFNYPYSYLDLDDILLVHQNGIRLNKKTCRDRSQLESKFCNIFQEMDSLLNRMSSIRPMLENEVFCRNFFLKASMRLIQVELYLCDPEVMKSMRKRKVLPQIASDVLQAWFDAHQDHPYPSQEDKKQFAKQGGITLQQVEYWFTNARFRFNRNLRRRREAEATRDSQ